MKRYLLLGMFLSGCTTPQIVTNAPLLKYNDVADYAIETSSQSDSIFMACSRYQFIPETQSLFMECKGYLKRLALKTYGIIITDDEIAMSFGRNGLTGISSCVLNVNTKHLNK